jgi:prepilin-type N-terminal cleavage/methylation domain-containing protein
MKQAGLTMLELVIVVVMLGILASTTSASIGSMK